MRVERERIIIYVDMMPGGAMMDFCGTTFGIALNVTAGDPPCEAATVVGAIVPPR